MTPTDVLLAVAILSLLFAAMAAVGDWLDRRDIAAYRRERKVRDRLIRYVEYKRWCCREVERIGGPVTLAIHWRECHERRAA